MGRSKYLTASEAREVKIDLTCRTQMRENWVRHKSSSGYRWRTAGLGGLTGISGADSVSNASGYSTLGGEGHELANWVL